MGRSPRLDVEGAWHHVMNRGSGRRRTFFTRRDGELFEWLIGQAHDRFAVEVHAYCLMPNHFHLLVHCPNGGLAAFMQRISSNYTRAVNDHRQTDGPLFRGRYHSLVVDDPTYVVAATRYIHRNPTASNAGTSSLADYRWSSHAAYLGARARPRWLRTDHVLDMFPGGVDGYREFVDPATSFDVAAVPDRHLLGFIELVVDECSVEHIGGRQRLARSVAVALTASVDDATRRRLERSLEFSDPLILAQAKRRTAERLDASPEFATLVERVHRRVAALPSQPTPRTGAPHAA